MCLRSRYSEKLHAAPGLTIDCLCWENFLALLDAFWNLALTIQQLA